MYSIKELKRRKNNPKHPRKLIRVDLESQRGHWPLVISGKNKHQHQQQSSATIKTISTIKRMTTAEPLHHTMVHISPAGSENRKTRVLGRFSLAGQRMEAKVSLFSATNYYVDKIYKTKDQCTLNHPSQRSPTGCPRKNNKILTQIECCVPKFSN